MEVDNEVNNESRLTIELSSCCDGHEREENGKNRPGISAIQLSPDGSVIFHDYSVDSWGSILNTSSFYASTASETEEDEIAIRCEGVNDDVVEEGYFGDADKAISSGSKKNEVHDASGNESELQEMTMMDKIVSLEKKLRLMILDQAMNEKEQKNNENKDAAGKSHCLDESLEEEEEVDDGGGDSENKANTLAATEDMTSIASPPISSEEDQREHDAAGDTVLGSLLEDTAAKIMTLSLERMVLDHAMNEEEQHEIEKKKDNAASGYSSDKSLTEGDDDDSLNKANTLTETQVKSEKEEKTSIATPSNSSKGDQQAQDAPGCTDFDSFLEETSVNLTALLVKKNRPLDILDPAMNEEEEQKNEKMDNAASSHTSGESLEKEEVDDDDSVNKAKTLTETQFENEKEVKTSITTSPDRSKEEDQRQHDAPDYTDLDSPVRATAAKLTTLSLEKNLRHKIPDHIMNEEEQQKNEKKKDNAASSHTLDESLKEDDDDDDSNNKTTTLAEVKNEKEETTNTGTSPNSSEEEENQRNHDAPDNTDLDSLLEETTAKFSVLQGFAQLANQECEWLKSHYLDPASYLDSIPKSEIVLPRHHEEDEDDPLPPKVVVVSSQGSANMTLISPLKERKQIASGSKPHQPRLNQQQRGGGSHQEASKNKASVNPPNNKICEPAVFYFGDHYGGTRTYFDEDLDVEQQDLSSFCSLSLNEENQENHHQQVRFWSEKEESLYWENVHKSILWDLRFEELRQFKQKYGHCKVRHGRRSPRAATPELARWVAEQKVAYKQYLKGEMTTLPTRMTAERMERLKQVGLVRRRRRGGNKKKNYLHNKNNNEDERFPLAPQVA